MKGKQRSIVAVEDPHAPAEGDPWFILTNAVGTTVSTADVAPIFHWPNWIEESYKESKQGLGGDGCLCLSERA
jgi:hypothetical protein